MRKTFSILFALALVLSFSLVATTPVAADGGWSDDFDSGAQQTWVVLDGGDNSTHVFQNDRYELHTESVPTGSEKYIASYVDESYTDCIMQGRVETISGGDNFLTYLLARCTPALGSGYVLGTSSSGVHLWFGKLTGGVYSTIAAASPPAYDPADFQFRFAVFGDTLVGKVWSTGSVEPAAWQIAHADADYSSGVGGVMLATYPALNWDVVQATFDDVSLTPLSQTVVWVDDDWDGTAANAEVEPGKIFGYNAFATIQGGIDAVDEGGTVNVAAGTYGEALSVAQTVTLKGAGSGSTIVEPAAGGIAITIETGAELTLTLQDIQLKATGSGRGINCNDRTQETTIILEDSLIDYSQHGRGINVFNSPNTSVTLIGSTVDATDADGALSGSRGLQIWDSSESSVTITDSTVAAGHYALLLVNSEDVEVNISDGSALTAYGALFVLNSPAGGRGGHTINVEDSVLTGRSFWSGYFYNPPHEGADSFGAVAIRVDDVTVNVVNSIITNEWIDGATSYEALILIGHPSVDVTGIKIYLDSATQLLNTNTLYAPLDVVKGGKMVGGTYDGGGVGDSAWYVDGVEQHLPAMQYIYYVHPDGDDASDGLTPARAFKSVQPAIDAAGSGDSILVVGATYGGFSPWLDAEITGGVMSIGPEALVETAGVSVDAAGGNTNTMITVAEYVGEPTGVSTGFQAGAFFFDVHVDGTLPTQLVVTAECPGADCSGMILKWFDGAEWKDVSPVSYTNGEVVATLSDTSSPTIAQLTGTPFGLGGPLVPFTLPDYVVGWDGSAVNKMAVLGPWIVLFAVLIAGAGLLVWRRRRVEV